jgi:hypothetical protein
MRLVSRMEAIQQSEVVIMVPILPAGRSLHT